MAYFKAGDPSRARQLMQEVLRMDAAIPEFPSAKELIEAGKTPN